MKKLMFVMAMAAAMNGFASFSYQGALKLADGSAVTNRSVIIRFSLYDGPGDDAQRLWYRDQAVVVSPTNGLFNVEIGGEGAAPDPTSGDGGPAPQIDDILATYKDLYLGLDVDGSSGEIRPRQRILPVPTASFARNVREARDDFTVSSNLFVKGMASVAGTTEFTGDVAVTGKLRIGGSKSEVMPMPIGGIIMWSQPNPPAGDENWANLDGSCHWAICDGGKYNNVQTPNLVDRFVIGTTPIGYRALQLGATGGTNEVTLSLRQLPVHSHLYRQDSDLSGSVTDWNVNPGGPVAHAGTGFPGKSGDYGRIVRTGTAGGNSSDGESGSKTFPHENMPPYYALYYIMRVK